MNANSGSKIIYNKHKPLNKKRNDIHITMDGYNHRSSSCVSLSSYNNCNITKTFRQLNIMYETYQTLGELLDNALIPEFHSLFDLVADQVTK